jgi:hypothetical protein
VGLFQQMREAPERVRIGKFMAAFFQDAPLSVVAVVSDAVTPNALAFALKKMGDKSGRDPEALMQMLLNDAKAGDAEHERVARNILGVASHGLASSLPLELIRAHLDAFVEIQSHNYVNRYDLEAAFGKAFGRFTPS